MKGIVRRTALYVHNTREDTDKGGWSSGALADIDGLQFASRNRKPAWRLVV